MAQTAHHTRAAHPAPASQTVAERPYFIGTCAQRQGVGLPGHCYDCVDLGHVAAHPDFGCGDVGCHVAHGPHDPA